MAITWQTVAGPSLAAAAIPMQGAQASVSAMGEAFNKALAGQQTTNQYELNQRRDIQDAALKQQILQQFGGSAAEAEAGYRSGGIAELIKARNPNEIRLADMYKYASGLSGETATRLDAAHTAALAAGARGAEPGLAEAAVLTSLGQDGAAKARILAGTKDGTIPALNAAPALQATYTTSQQRAKDAAEALKRTLVPGEVEVARLKQAQDKALFPLELAAKQREDAVGKINLTVLDDATKATNIAAQIEDSVFGKTTIGGLPAIGVRTKNMEKYLEGASPKVRYLVEQDLQTKDANQFAAWKKHAGENDIIGSVPLNSSATIAALESDIQKLPPEQQSAARRTAASYAQKGWSFADKNGNMVRHEVPHAILRAAMLASASNVGFPALWRDSVEHFADLQRDRPEVQAALLQREEAEKVLLSQFPMALGANATNPNPAAVFPKPAPATTNRGSGRFIH